MRMVICDRCETEIESINAFSEKPMLSVYLAGGGMDKSKIKTRFELCYECTDEFLNDFMKDGE